MSQKIRFISKLLPLQVFRHRHLMKKIGLFSFFLFFFAYQNFAQNFSDIEKTLLKGNKYAVRDLGSVVEDAKNGQKAQSLLSYYCYFKGVNLKSKTEFLDFYFRNEKNIHFSFLYNLFYINDLEAEKVFFETNKKSNSRFSTSKLSDWKSKINEQINVANIDSTVALLNKMEQLHYGEECFKFLQSLSNDTRIAAANSTKRMDFYRTICDILGTYPTLESLEQVLRLVETEKIPPALTSFSLARITNIFSANEGLDINQSKRYRHYLDSLKTLDAMQKFGYHRFEPNFEPFFFEEKVDYYGALLYKLNEKEGFWWLRNNVIKDLIAEHNPRALYYLAAQMFHQRGKKERYYPTSLQYFNVIQGLLNDDVVVKDSLNNKVFEIEKMDNIAVRNYFIYWIQNWQNYEWDDYKNAFLSKSIKEEEKERLDRLFRRLTATNDSIAVNAYQTLSVSDPFEIKRLSDKYRGLLRNVNPLLPELKKMFLDQTVVFTDYCKQAQIDIKTSPKLTKLLSDLQQCTSPKLCLVIENDIVNEAKFEDISALEYWALLHANNLQNSYALSRIIELLYVKNWAKVEENNDNLRQYLKKSAIFSKVQTIGFCHQYLEKIDTNNQAKVQKLRLLLSSENDLEIVSELYKVLNMNFLQKEIIENNNEEVTTSDVLNLSITLQIENLKKQDSIGVNDLNLILKRSDFEQKYRNNILSLIGKIRPQDDVSDLNISPKIDPNSEGKYIVDARLTKGNFTRFLRIFQLEKPNEIINFLKPYLADLPINNQGIIWNDLFRQRWFTDYINSGKLAVKDADFILNLLNQYLQNAESMSDYEEKNVLQHISVLSNIGKPIEQQLQATLNLDVDENTKADLINEIIAHASFAEIPKILPFVEQLQLRNGKSPYTFLSEDFGLPIFEFENGQDLLLLQKNIETKKPLEVYTFYLQRFGINIWNSDKSLNINGIRNILKHDIVIPFAGGGGVHRDWYVYSVIKVLELTLNNRLGFQEKLNENQTFYAYNASKRAQAWVKYLDKK